jgi:hypothetical protein
LEWLQPIGRPVMSAKGFKIKYTEEVEVKTDALMNDRGVPKVPASQTQIPHSLVQAPIMHIIAWNCFIIRPFFVDLLNITIT